MLALLRPDVLSREILRPPKSGIPYVQIWQFVRSPAIGNPIHRPAAQETATATHPATRARLVSGYEHFLFSDPSGGNNELTKKKGRPLAAFGSLLPA